MSKDSNEDSATSGGKSPASVLILSIADTTWRMFIPIIGCLLLGRLADDYWHIKPLGMVIGIVVGCVITGLLIKQLFEKEV